MLTSHIRGKLISTINFFWDNKGGWRERDLSFIKKIKGDITHDRESN